MSNEELLQKLRDIQPPTEPDWWLIAPVYLLMIAIVIALSGIGWWLLQQRQANRLTRLAEDELQAIQSDYSRCKDARRLAVKTSRWLKQVALLAFPERHLQAMSGNAWLHFLDQSLGETGFSQGSGRVFGSAVYQSQVELDAEQIFSLCQRWLKAVEPSLRQRSRLT
jgi:hypothetical protein